MIPRLLLDLFMILVGSAESAELADPQLVALPAGILRRRVVLPLAAGKESSDAHVRRLYRHWKKEKQPGGLHARLARAFLRLNKLDYLNKLD